MAYSSRSKWHAAWFGEAVPTHAVLCFVEADWLLGRGVGHVLAYIFTDRESLPVETDEVGRIIHQCCVHNVDQRYQPSPR